MGELQDLRTLSGTGGGWRYGLLGEGTGGVRVCSGEEVMAGAADICKTPPGAGYTSTGLGEGGCGVKTWGKQAGPSQGWWGCRPLSQPCFSL